MPALTAAWRAVDLAGTGLEDLAHEHVVDLIGGHAAAGSSAALMAMPPRSVAANPANAPESLPIGVRAPLRMTEPAMVSLPRVTGPSV